MKYYFLKDSSNLISSVSVFVASEYPTLVSISINFSNDGALKNHESITEKNHKIEKMSGIRKKVANLLGDSN